MTCGNYHQLSILTNETSELPFVSIIIPCRDEEAFISKCLDSIIANDYPKNKLEVLVVDGMSQDSTREIVSRYETRYPFIKLLSNIKRITPVALNMGIKHSRGHIIMRMDAHATYGGNYISRAVRYLDEYEADNVGGRMITIPRNDTFIGRAIVVALSHRFGVGGSVFRTGSDKPRYVDTVFGGCYRRQVFDRVGLFNENLASTQDMEFNLRLRRSGGKILLHPEIVSYYYTRSDFRSFCRNNLRNGVWAIYPMKFVQHMPVSWRHLVPLAFVSSLVIAAALSCFSQLFLWISLFTLGSYVLANVCFSIGISLREKDVRYLLIMPIIFATLHISYGLGSIWGIAKLLRG